MRSDETLQILHVTDSHLHADPDKELYGVQTDRSFRAVVERALNDTRWRPAAVLATGDLVEDHSRRGYERFREIMAPCGLPVLCLPGNHDDPALMSQVLDDDLFSFCATHERLEAGLTGSNGRHVLVNVHHQPIDMGSTWLDGYGLRNGPELLSMLSRHAQVKGVLWGHVHQASDRQRPPGFRRLNLKADGGIDSEVVWLDDWVINARPPDSRVGE
jgi:Icc protein